MKVMTPLLGFIVLITVSLCLGSIKENIKEIGHKSQLPIDVPVEIGSHVKYDLSVGPTDISANPYYDPWHPLHPLNRRPFAPDIPCLHHNRFNRNLPFNRLHYERLHPNWLLRQNWDNYYNRLDEPNPQLIDPISGPNSYGYEYSLPGGGYSFFHRYLR